jgi:hypothetical protein
MVHISIAGSLILREIAVRRRAARGKLALREPPAVRRNQYPAG